MTPAPYHIAIIAPSGYAPDEAAYQRGLQRLRALGHTVYDLSAGTSRHQRFAASDTARVAQLHAAADHPEAEIVIAVRGGYGLSRLLPEIDFSHLASSGKLFVGHSDFTVLQMGLLAQGAISIAGPMICDDFSRDDLSEFTHRHFWQAVSEPAFAVRVDTPGNPAVTVEGRLWGGNLAMLSHLAGTRWMPTVDDGMLFVEDINEHPYRVERMLLQLMHAGVLHRQRAILLGDFSGYRLAEYDNGYDFGAMVDYLRERLGLPVLTGLPFGHVRDKLSLPVGGHGRVEADASGFSLQVSR
ncbi:MAG: muramoyltetrapeptide carboxypeptidase [Oxalobacteraceae bacterium]|nr:muramoyltetrapeptide carboxypeptidase [Sphingomonadales bacterium]